jgi:hypothetical protein
MVVDSFYPLMITNYQCDGYPTILSPAISFGFEVTNFIMMQQYLKIRRKPSKFNFNYSGKKLFLEKLRLGE